jgi:subtilisin family serine protease
MARGTALFAALLAILATCAAAAAGTASAASATDPYVVVYDRDVTDVDAATKARAVRLGFATRFRYHAAVEGFAARLTDRQARALRADDRVAAVVEDEVFTGEGKATPAPTPASEVVPTGVRRIGGPRGAASGAVAVLDTGIDLKNADLNAVSGRNCVATASPAQDDHGHGTHVAGTIGARANGAGVVGLAPGTKLYAVKVLNAKNAGTLSQLLCGIDWVTQNAAALGIDVASMSIGGAGADDGACGRVSGDARHRALCASTAAGVTWVASAGNGKGDLAKTVPASFSEVLAVTAMTDSDGVAGATGGAPACSKAEVDDRAALGYSNFAVSAEDAAHTIAAPGTCILSTKLGGGTGTMYGTSAAAPHAAAAAALCHGTASGGAGPCATLTPAEVVQRLRSDAAAQATAQNGFAGDALHPFAGKAFGHLVAVP